MAIKSFNAIAGFSVGEVPANVILANGDITTSKITSTGNITGGNILTGGLFSATGTVTGGNVATAGAITGASSSVSGIVTGASVVGGVITGTTVSTTGNITGGNLATAGAITGASSSVSGIVTGASVVGGVITGSSTSVTGIVTAASVVGGVITGSSISVSGAVTAGASSFSGAVAMGTNKITGLGTPTADTDASTKAYVDSVAQGLDTKASVVAATTANITLSGTQTVDGIVLVATDRVLVKNQTASADNGIYLCAAGVWTRTTDMDTWAEVPGAFVFVEGGTTQADTGWVCTADAGGTIGTTAMPWAQFSSAGSYYAGAGLTLTGSTFSVNASQTQITSVGTLTALAVTGNITSGNVQGTLYSGTTVSVTGAITGASVVGGVITGTSVSVTGNITSAANVSGSYILGNGSQLTGIAASYGNADVAANLAAFGSNPISTTGNITAGNISATGIAGTLSTAAQTSITSVGTLTSVVTSGAVVINDSRIQRTTATTTSTSADQTISSITLTANPDFGASVAVRYLVKGYTATGGRFSAATIQAIVDTATPSIEWVVYGQVGIGSATGSGFGFSLSAGVLALTVTPASSNSTIWTVQAQLV